jgi:hypothetical protein
MSFFRRLQKLRKPLTTNPRSQLFRRSTLHLEVLEDRITPSILFSPQNGAENATNGGGQILGQSSWGVPIYTIYWGSYWGTSGGAAYASQIQNAINSFLYFSPYLDGLHQYGTSYRAGVPGSGTVQVFNYSDPSNGFSVSDLQNIVNNGIDNQGLPESDTYSNEGIYVVLTPPGISTMGDGGYHTNDSDYDFPFDFDSMVEAWVGTNGGIDGTTNVFSHEVAEAMTDPNGDAWQVDPRGSSSWNEICDNEAQNYSYRINGYQVQSYWSQSNGAYLVPDGNSQNFWVNNGTLNLYGDQFGSGYNDSISIDTNGSGGVYVNMNGEVASFDAGRISSINVYGYGGNNTINVYNTNVNVTIQSGGYDTVNLGNGYDGVQGIQGSVNVTNPPYYTALNINDGANGYGRTASVYNNAIYGLAPGAIYYNQYDLSSLRIYGGYGGNTFYVYGTPTNGHGVSNYLNSGNGSNTVYVAGTNNYLSVDGGSGVQSVYVGTSSSSFGSGNLANIQGSVDVYNSSTAGFSYLYVDDSGDSSGQTMNVYFDQITQTASSANIYWTTYGSGYGGVTYLQTRGGHGYNTFNVYSTGSSPWSYFTDVETGTGGANVNIQSTLGSMEVNNQGGHDNVTIGSLAPTDSGGTVANINGYVDIFGTGDTWLYVDDSGDTSGKTVSMYDGQLSGLAPANIYWSPSSTSSGGVTYLNVKGGSGGDTFNVYGTSNFFYWTYLLSGSDSSSFNHVNILATGGNGGAPFASGTTGGILVDAGNDGQQVTIGSNAPTIGGGTLANIQGYVYAYETGTTGYTWMYVDDSGDTNSRAVAMADGQITGLPAAGIYWTDGSSASNSGGTEYVEFHGGSAANTFTVTSTSNFYYSTYVYTGAGNNTFSVMATTGYLGISEGGGINTVNVGNAGNMLDNIHGTVNVFGGAGQQLNINDQGSSSGTSYSLSSNSISRSGTASIFYSGQAAVAVTGSNAGSTYNVETTAAGTTTTVTAGGGSDVFNVSPTAMNFGNIAGALTLAGGGGTNTLTINDQNDAAADTYSLATGSVQRTGTAGLTYTGMQGVTVNGGSGSVTYNVNSTGAGTSLSLNGGSGNNTLIGPNTTQTWTISGVNSGSLGSQVSFSAMRNLVGGTGSDTFKFTGTSGSVAGTISGGSAGTDKLDYSGLTAAQGPISVNLQTSAATRINGGVAGGFNHIVSLAGSASTADILTGTNADTTWTIKSANGGTAGTFTFTGIENLMGGSGVDVFTFTSSGSVAGSINGGGAPTHKGNWLNYSSLSTTVVVNLQTGSATAVAGGSTGKVNNIQNVHGGNGGNTLTGNSQGNILIGGTGADTINGGSGASLLIGEKGKDNVTGGSGGDILIGDYTTYDSMTTANETALMSILAEWQSGDSYATRFQDINTGTGGGLNGTNRLNYGTTVKNDTVADTITAAASAQALDWFFKGSNDTIHNKENGEHVNNT